MSKIGKNKKFTGFTLIEIAVAVAIIGIMISAITTVVVTNSRKQGRDAARIIDIRQLQNALELYFLKVNTYPATLDVLAPDYIAKIPKDPLGIPYYYVALDKTGDIYRSYHLGANLETDSPVLKNDADAPSGGEGDFAGADNLACGGGSGKCYDINPEYAAAGGEQMAAPGGGGGGGGAPEGGGAPPPEEGPSKVDEVSGLAGAAGEHFTFSSRGVTPVFVSADIVPRDVQVGETQTLTVAISDAAGISQVTAETQLDHSIKYLALAPQGAGAGCTNCTWSVSWIVNDTSHNTYSTKFIARNTLGQENSVTLAWTDPCSPPMGGNFTLDASCSMTGTVNGVDNGNFYIASPYTLTINSGQTIAWNSGYSIIFQGGSIAKSSGGVISKAYLYIQDADNDTYPSSPTAQLTGSSPSSPPQTGYRRRYTASSVTDVNDGNGAVWQNLSCYVDGDSDGVYSTSTSVVQCGASCGSGCTNASGSPGTDCDDGNSIIQANKSAYTDSDGDGYTVSAGTICLSSAAWGNSACTTAGTSYSKNSIGGCQLISSGSGTDCLDSNSYIYQNVGSLVTDADRDHYTTGSAATQCVGPSDGTWYRDSSGSYTWLPSVSSSGSDCNDGNGSIWANGYGQDDDGDGYGLSAYGCNNGTAPYTATTGVDCYDKNPCAKTGQTSYFTVNRGTSSVGCTVVGGGGTDSGGNVGTSFDYNCNSTAESYNGTTGNVTCTFSCGHDGSKSIYSSQASTRGWIGAYPGCGGTDWLYSDTTNCVLGSCSSAWTTESCR